MLIKFLSRVLERRDLFRARYQTKAVAKKRHSPRPGVEALETRDLLSAALPGLSQTNWLSVGPAPISVLGADTDSPFAPAQYSTASGPVTAVVADPNDPTGQILYVGTENGGIWKTTNGGTTWTPLTDFQTDQAGNRIPVNVGALAIARTSSNTLYAGLGVAMNAPDARPGAGVLKSVDGGNTWTLVGNSVLAGARISKIVIDPRVPNLAYAAVAQGGSQGPGLYRTLDGGQTWVNVLRPQNMYADLHLPGAPVGALGAGFALPSVTDVVIDPFNPNNVYVGLGNIGEVATSPAAGLWKTTESSPDPTASPNLVWNQVAGGEFTGRTLPLWTASGVTWQTIGNSMGRVLVTLGRDAVTSETIIYVLVSNPPSPDVPGNFNHGTGEDDTNAGGSTGSSDSPISTGPLGMLPSGLYKSSDNGLNFTKVMLRQMDYDPGNPPKEHPKDINLAGVEASDLAALTIDPTNPDVVYVGGSRRFTANDPYGSRTHALIRVDTSNMLSNGDDADKAFWAAQSVTINGTTVGPGKYPSGATYIGEGVFWYDLEQDASGGPSGGRLLPRAVDSLTFDTQGHLLIGTPEGVFRALGPGVDFGYDITSGGQGIAVVKGQQPPYIPPADLNTRSLNTNLAIADLISVAVDPVQEGRFYTTEFNNGSSFSDPTGAGSLTWQVAGNDLTGPGLLDMPHGARVRVGAPDPLNPNAMPFVYRTWYYGHSGAAVVERSDDGGQTFESTQVFGTDITQPAQALPPLAVAPNRVQALDPATGQVVFYDEVFFGTNRVYLGRTNANEWSVLGPDRPLSAKGGLISSLASGAPLVERLAVVYAGTTAGELFVNFRDGSGWLNRSAGLPGLPILDITVSPNNPLVAYVTMSDVPGDGKASEVWYTANGGQTWANISSNLPQNITAYALAFDPRAFPTTPQGRIYVGTDVGVYLTLNNGASWQPLGNGLPNVPVVDLQFEPNNDLLAAATQGRGVFVLSTDIVGPRVVAFTPTTPAGPDSTIPEARTPISSVTVTFNEPIAVQTFGPDDVRIVGPGGRPVQVFSVMVVSVTNDQTFQITFDAQGETPLDDGTYTVTILPGLTDVVGNLLDQNGNAINGEASDSFSFVFAINSSDDGRFITGLYHDLLGLDPTGRPADTGGFLSFLGPVDAARFQVLSATARGDAASREARFYSVAGLYTNFLHRTGGDTEYAFWVNAIANGQVTQEQIIASFVESDEYFQKFGIGSTPQEKNAAWLKQVYLDVLGRDPDHPGSDGFLDGLNNGTLTRAQVANAIVFSDESLRRIVSATFTNFLGRLPGEGDFGAWVPLLRQATFAGGLTPREQMISALASSLEYFERQGNTNRGWVTDVLQKVLGRSAADPKFPDWVSEGVTNIIQQYSGALHATATALTGSPEYRARLIQSYYRTYLNRSAGPQEVAGWEAVFRSGARDEQVLAAILGSPEFFNRAQTLFGSGTPDERFVKALYLLVLNRTASSNEVSGWAQLLAQGVSRQQVALAFLNSTEYRQDLVAGFYNKYLGRNKPAQPGSSDPEVNFWVGALNNGATQEQVIAGMLASPEYFQRLHLFP
jgi:photosystem II stability/assembly factor-like uncharacterized protein